MTTANENKEDKNFFFLKKREKNILSRERMKDNRSKDKRKYKRIRRKKNLTIKEREKINKKMIEKE